MPSDQRVVLRSSWPATFANSSPIILVFLAFQIADRSVGEAIVMIIVVVAVTATLRDLLYIELTPQGLDIHRFGLRRVPWQDISSVELVNRFGGHNLRIHDVARQRGRYLPSPRGSFGVGKKEAAEARDLIEQWRQAYSNQPLPIAYPTLPPATPGGPDDPWRSPLEE
jgi:hypothetical protein